MTKTYPDLPPIYEYETLKRWGERRSYNKAVETPDGKYICAIISIDEAPGGVDMGFFTLFENAPPHRLTVEFMRRPIYANSQVFSSDGKILLHLWLKHRFSDTVIRSFIVIDPDKRSFALIPFRDGKGESYHCDELEHIGGSKYRTLPGKVKFDLDKLTYYPLEKINDFTEVDIPRFRLGAVEPVPVFSKRNPSIIGYLIRQLHLHPSTTVTDILKQCYQAAYGAEHLLTDKVAARRYLEREFEATPAKDILLCEHISDEFCRVNIAAWKHRGLPSDDLFELFAASAHPRENGRELLEGFLREAEEYVDLHEEFVFSHGHHKRVKLFGEHCTEAVEEYRRSGMPAIHHSDAYREAEHPAYRIVETKLLREYFEKK